MNLRANFDKNKKASRIKVLREFTMKRLTDFFGEKDWKTVEIRYNENMKRSKHCCWTVPKSDWNKWLFPIWKNIMHLLFGWTIPMSDWNLPNLVMFHTPLQKSWTVPMSDWNMIVSVIKSPPKNVCWTVSLSDILLLLNSLFYTNTMNCFVNLQRKYE